MATISANTIVRNGMPFIGKVLRQVAPLVDELRITISEKSNDGTVREVDKVFEDFPGKVFVDFENVENQGELTQVQQAQADKSTGEWILFLSDDDYWPINEFRKCVVELDKNPDVLAYSINPYQLLDYEHYDASWNNKSFSKFLRKEGMKYIGTWPRELPSDKYGKPLYWKTHARVQRLQHRFYHLSYLKDSSFRNEEWAKQFRFKRGKPVKLPHPVQI